MLAARTMAFLAADTQHQTGFAEPVEGRRKPTEARAMAFEAAWNDGLVEARGAVRKPRTVDPTIQFSPVGHGQFKEPVALPKQVALAFAPASDHDIDALGVRNRLRGREFFDRTLEKAILGGTHGKRQVGIGGPEDVRSRGEFSGNRIRARQPRREMVGRPSIGVGDRLVAGPASLVSHGVGEGQVLLILIVIILFISVQERGRRTGRTVHQPGLLGLALGQKRQARCEQ